MKQARMLSLAGVAAAALTLVLAIPTASRAAQGGETQQVALKYYRTLAEGGSADAQLALGDVYRSGNGVSANLVQAFAWYYLAAQQGVPEAIGPMNETLRAIPQTQWPEAKRLAEEYAQAFVLQSQ